ncbi:MAG TPA: tetratricopeptide repeat protein [Anaeromyxobacter sp.]|nr:tetratricopeptide repeat protein [Anaeromyxobacter sp.]
MPQVTCARCFAVFDSDDARPGAVPVCPACAPRAAGGARPTFPAAAARPRAGRRRRSRAAVAAVVGAAAALAVAVVLVLHRRSEPPPAPAPRVVDVRVEEWRTAKLVSAAAVPDPARADARAAAGFEALGADMPQRTAAALQAFREAIAIAPSRADSAIGGYAFAFAELAGEETDGAELRAAHDLVREALARSPDRPELLVGYARLLLVVPGQANAAEALAVAARAVQRAPADPAARLVLGLARLASDPPDAARILEEALAAAPRHRRLLAAAARARWAADDAAGALAHAAERLALDPDHPGALQLRAEVELASDRVADARATLGRWEAAVPASPLPPLLLAELAYQVDDDAALARRLLAVALSRDGGAFTAARILAHRAAVESLSGDFPAAQAAVDDALRRVPGSAPARFQAALLAFHAGNAAALRESAGVLGDRAGPVVRKLLAARSAELSGTDEEAQQAYLAVAEAAPGDPAVLLATAGALARLRAPGLALEVAKRALARDPLEARLRRVPSDFWESTASLAEAARRLEAIARDEPSRAATSLAAAALCELLLGRTVAAERLAKEAAAASPQAVPPQIVLAQVAIDRGQPMAAAAPLRSALELRPGDGVALATRARAFAAVGRMVDAEASYRAAYEAAPHLATVRLGLARLAARRGDAPGARALLEALVRDEPRLSEARGALVALSDRPAQAPAQGAASPAARPAALRP